MGSFTPSARADIFLVSWIVSALVLVSVPVALIAADAWYAAEARRPVSEIFTSVLDGTGRFLASTGIFFAGSWFPVVAAAPMARCRPKGDIPFNTSELELVAAPMAVIETTMMILLGGDLLH
jgi:hypothetical protein